ncbi:MAG TPA: class E sortase [Candidatus Saccharimonadales bacterium]|jgi:sortase A|nr:class E sortase [Candidatus Saccharimonadales bacterium]
MATNSDLSDSDNQAASSSAPDAGPAVDLIRQKLDRIYQDEPDAFQELAEAEAVPRRSKHQKFMYELSASGKDLASVQTEWHNYYQSLPDNEKHQVWQEFYSSQSLMAGQPAVEANPQAMAEHKHQAASPPRQKAQPKVRDIRSKGEVKAVIRNKVSAGGKLEAKHHLQSLLFGLSMGFAVLIIFLFGFFNEVVIAPFIQPSRVQADTPLIINSNSVAPSATPEVIIPKINVEIPVNYNETSTDESTIESDLNDGVVHYPTTSVPGQNGNAAFFGHSSNNIFNKGKYKFAFVLLHTLVNGDTFYLTYNSKVYVYKVISHTIVDPSDVGVLEPVPGQTATATLITCDPPGTSIHRLVVVGQQVSPDPSANTASTAGATPTTSASLPNDGPTAWSKYIGTGLGKASLVMVLLGAIALGFRKIWRPLVGGTA